MQNLEDNHIYTHIHLTDYNAQWLHTGLYETVHRRAPSMQTIPPSRLQALLDIIAGERLQSLNGIRRIATNFQVRRPSYFNGEDTLDTRSLVTGETLGHNKARKNRLAMLQDAKPRIHYRSTELILQASAVTDNRVKQGLIEAIEAMRPLIVCERTGMSAI